ncbi:phospholipase D-like domain-containing anti-phage protein [Caloramator australicus]|uniref:Helicase domain protein n=1 Tax=Caloramator australicus RC3 TaxID=857293 RepID=I7J532_9CLOT|nr:phospholipase D-like domain-containing anti-phage protein [Caloramator australicus]CCJ33436.1 helicase domain protein [Caloramator australicus RC3]
MIYRYSSRRQKLDKAFLDEKLRGALAYDRIAGYFSSSILEVVGEALESVEGIIRVVCNSELSKEDVKTAKAAMEAQRREWCESEPENRFINAGNRLEKLYNLLKSGKLQIKVVPNDVFGLIHGKAGVITLKDGRKTSFIGSVNETSSAWRLNYEILWEDDSEEAVNWVQEEFDFFWNSQFAVPLSDFIIEDIKRLSKRKVIYSVEEWRKNPDPASTVIESPVYRKELGLWEHQKYFINLAFEDHKKSYGARYVLADMVGLGKTVQLAMAAQLMALYGDKPILIIVPKTLLWQWQDELYNLLDMPSAVWTGREWVDENGLKYPSNGDISIKKCPRRIGIISQGLITANSPVVDYLLSLEYECVIVDEAHRARRKKYNQGNDKTIAYESNQNNLMRFLMEISKRTKSMLLATATPVQLHPIEAWDLLEILSQKNDSVLGSKYSKWRTQPERALNLLLGNEEFEEFDLSIIDWIRDPFPPENEEEINFAIIRKRAGMKEDDFVLSMDVIESMKNTPDYRKLGRVVNNNTIKLYNPFIRHIVRRTRDFLENTINPETNEPYLKKVEVKLFGEREEEAIVLPPYLKKAYGYAEAFSVLLQKRVKGGGFLKTLLLKRVGSTIIAGKNTAEKMLSNWNLIEEDDYEDDDAEKINEEREEIKNLTVEEKECLKRFIECLENNQSKDPKYELTLKLLIDDKWIERGCIIFSQYYDSAFFIAENLSKDLKLEKIGLYAGGDKSGIFIYGVFYRKTKEEIKQMVRKHELRVLVGTDAASEGLNLQTLGCLINLDLPWNPTRLEQRKGRIQRIGQIYDEVYIYNMRYKDSVEDRVHELLSTRLENIHNLFGQIPDVLEDVWVKVALNEIEEAKHIIDAVPKQHPFELRYNQVKRIKWESCATILDSNEKKKCLMNGWK